MICYTSPNCLVSIDTNNTNHRRFLCFLISKELNEEVVKQQIQKFELRISYAKNMSILMPPVNVISKWQNSRGLPEDFKMFVNEYTEFLEASDMFGSVGAILNNHYGRQRKDIIFLCSEDEITKLKYMDAFAEILACRYSITVWNPSEFMEIVRNYMDIREYQTTTVQGEQMLKKDYEHSQLKTTNHSQSININGESRSILANSQTKGIISRFLSDKGYGFINFDSGSCFFHISDIKSQQILPEEGQRVKFDVVMDKKGQRAKNIDIISSLGEFLRIKDMSIKIRDIENCIIRNDSEETLQRPNIIPIQIKACMQDVEDLNENIKKFGFSVDVRRIYENRLSTTKSTIAELEREQRNLPYSTEYKLAKKNLLECLCITMRSGDFYVFYQHESDFNIHERREEILEDISNYWKRTRKTR